MNQFSRRSECDTALIVITASFVAEPLEVPLSWLLNEAGLADNVRFSPYNQIFQQLLSPGSELANNTVGINVILVRFEDYVRDLVDGATAMVTIERTARELASALEKFADHVKGAIILGVLPPGPSVAADLSHAIVEAGIAFVNHARTLPQVHLLDEHRIDTWSDPDRYDLVRDRLAHIPYSEIHFAALALAIARRIHAIRVTPAKVLVLDCDNTLWRGVVGEDGIEGIEITEAFVALQEFAVTQQTRGVLVCLASKNIEADVLDVFERRTDMRLKASHIVAHRVNWDSKPANLRALAAELNLGLDAFVFLDDNPVECAQMRAQLPQVVTLQIPGEAALPRFLEHLWLFDKLVTTAEDAERTRMYRENSARRAMESSTGDIGQFLADLDLKIDIAEPAEDEWPRIEQLTQRTNQFNFTTRRRTALELKSLSAAGASVLRVRVSDRFGDYGLVGVVIASPESGAIRVDTFLLSCRVLGRGVEHAMLRRVGEIARDLNLPEVLLLHILTARNVPARAFADNVASAFAVSADGGKVYRMPVSHVLGIVHAPGRDPVEIVEARRADEKKAIGSASADASGRSERYARLARLDSGRTVIEQMSARPRRARTIAGEAAAPTTPLEEQLLQLWKELLEIDGIGVDDDYFSLGGTSLLSVRLFAEIGRRFAVQLSLTAILEAPTVRSLARLMITAGVQQRSNVVRLRAGGEHNMFLVHDGLGETLLYANLAKRLPQAMTVYGVEPRRLPGMPLAHGSMEDMAAFYVGQIQKIQPQGPYRLGGMCAGGVIAYQMAASLREAGEQVELVIILDGATPQAAKRVGNVARRRLSRLGGVMSQSPGGSIGSLKRISSIATSLARKARNVVSYEISAVAVRVSVRLRFALLRRLVRRNGSWPSRVPELTVIQIYNALEARYVPPKLSDVPVLLVRASAGEGTDTPYREFYRDNDLGWGRVARRLELIDVLGGHSSMLQEHAIDSLAEAVLKRLSGA